MTVGDIYVDGDDRENVDKDDDPDVRPMLIIIMNTLMITMIIMVIIIIIMVIMIKTDLFLYPYHTNTIIVL